MPSWDLSLCRAHGDGARRVSSVELNSMAESLICAFPVSVGCKGSGGCFVAHAFSLLINQTLFGAALKGFAGIVRVSPQLALS